jgi:hypothetical protein
MLKTTKKNVTEKRSANYLQLYIQCQPSQLHSYKNCIFREEVVQRLKKPAKTRKKKKFEQKKKFARIMMAVHSHFEFQNNRANNGRCTSVNIFTRFGSYKLCSIMETELIKIRHDVF